MQRYRRLTIEELEAVRPEFVKFLASEGIAAMIGNENSGKARPTSRPASMNSVRSSGTVLRLPSRASNTGPIRTACGCSISGNPPHT